MAELHLSESSGFSFGFEKSEDVSLSDGSFDVSDDGSLGVIEELDLDLKNELVFCKVTLIFLSPRLTWVH